MSTAEATGMREALLAFADCAEKLSEEHFIVQPFLNIYKVHGAAIAAARTLPIPEFPIDAKAMKDWQTVYDWFVENFSETNPLTGEAFHSDAREAVNSLCALRPISQDIPTDAAVKALVEARPHLECLRNYLDDDNCGNVCDKTYETQGCMGRCALEDGKVSLRRLLKNIDATLAANGVKS